MVQKTFSKRVEDFKAAKQISAYVIMKGAEKVGIINAHFGSGYSAITCTVDAWNFNDPEGNIFMQGKTHGGGYDLFTAAITGMTFDGVRIYDHCDTSEETRAQLAKYSKAGTKEAKEKLIDRARKAGMMFANWHTDGYTSCYYIGGLKRLEVMGYAVIQAI